MVMRMTKNKIKLSGNNLIDPLKLHVCQTNPYECK